VELGWASQGVSEAVVKLVAVWLGNAAIADSLQATPVRAHEISPRLVGQQLLCQGVAAPVAIPYISSGSVTFKHRNSCVAQRKRAGLITRRSLDRNESQLAMIFCFACFLTSNPSSVILFFLLRLVLAFRFLPKRPRFNLLSHQGDHPALSSAGQGFASPLISPCFQTS
jgi:hypothetical protein